MPGLCSVYLGKGIVIAKEFDFTKGMPEGLNTEEQAFWRQARDKYVRERVDKMLDAVRNERLDSLAYF